MEITNHLKRLTAIALSLVLLLSCAACEKSKVSNQRADDSQMREEAYRAIVQSTVNRYGILDEQASEVSWDLDTTRAKGLWGAEAFDITGDGKDELFLVYVADKKIEMQIFEYKNGSAQKAWHKSDSWGGIFNLRVYQADNCVCWTYTITRHFPVDFFAYIDGEYRSANDMGEYSQEEQNAVYDNLIGGLMQEGELWRDVMKKRLGIKDSGEYSEDDTYLSLAGEGILGAADIDRIVERWDITIPEPRLSPVEILGNIKYYGDKSICKMTKEMALAYAEVIESETEQLQYSDMSDHYIYAVLIDVAYDGIPLLATAWADENYEIGFVESIPKFHVWTWNGKKASRYQFENDINTNHIFGFEFYPNKNEGIIKIGDGCALGVGDADGNIYYKVSNGSITKVRHEMFYSAYVDDDISRGDFLPGVNAVKVDDYFYEAKTDDLLAAGWTGEVYDGEYTSLSISSIDGKLINAPYDSEKFWHNIYDRYNDNIESFDIMVASTGPHWISEDWTKGEALITSLKSYAKVAGKPFYSYEEVKSILTTSQLKAIAKEAAKKYDGKIGEIYRLSDDLYYIIIYVDDEFAGGVLVKNIKNGSEWKIITHSDKPMSEDALAGEVSNDSKISNIEIDYSKTDDGAEYIKEVLQKIDGTVPNDAAKSEITDYAESYITASGTDDIKAKKNCTNVTGKAIKDAVSRATDAHSELAGVLQEEGVALNKTITVIIRIVCKKMDLQTPATITIDQSVADALGSADAILFEIGDNSHTVKMSAEAIRALIGKYTAFSAAICKTANGTYDITFTDSHGNTIDKLEHGITFAVPASGELCTIHAEYSEGTDNWGGQYDKASGTLSFETPYSGTYTVFEDSEEITDISELSAEHQKAIRFMVSKGYFSLDGGKFNPDTSLTRYTFAETLVRMFFALDRSLDTTLTDVPKDSAYYPYVASGEHGSIIEGYEDHTFRGDNEVLREEVMALCSRTLRERKGYVEPDEASSYLHFTDNDMISDWALGEIALAVRAGLIDNGGILDPQTQISRADSALILYRLFMLLYEVEPAAKASDSGSIIIWSFAIFAGVLVITLIALVAILIKRKKSQATVSDAGNETSANDDITEQ